MHDESLDDTILTGARAVPANSAPATRIAPRVADLHSADLSGADIDDTIIVRRDEPDVADTIIKTPAPLAAPSLAAPLAAPSPAAPERSTAPDARPYVTGPPTESLAAPVLHYRLRIGATVVALDKVAYIGRKPSAPRVMRDGVPRLIQVPSPLSEVSGTHLEIRQRGTSVVITDLRSTNGSVINIPGRAPRKLCRGESLVVTAGTLVDIGDGNLVEILPMQRA